MLVGMFMEKLFGLADIGGTTVILGACYLIYQIIQLKFWCFFLAVNNLVSDLVERSMDDVNVMTFKDTYHFF